MEPIKGRFVKGRSGNPGGRPKKNNASLRDAIGKHANEIIAVLVENALNGDTAAAKVLLDRILPPIKPQTSPINVKLVPGDTPFSVGNRIFNEAMSGEIPSESAIQSIELIASMHKLHEFQKKIDSDL